MTATDLRPESALSTIELIVPAELRRTHIVRALTTRIAVAEDFDIDQVADLRLAVDEVCSTLVPFARPRSMLHCRFVVEPDQLRFAGEVVCEEPPETDLTSTFGWTVLTTLTDSAEVSRHPSSPDEGERLQIDVTKRRTPDGS